MVVKILAGLVFALLPIMAALRADVTVIDLMSVLYVGIGTLCFVAASPHNRWQAMGIGGLLSGLSGCLLGMGGHAANLYTGRDDAAAEHCGVAAAVWRGDFWHCENAGGLKNWLIKKLAD